MSFSPAVIAGIVLVVLVSAQVLIGKRIVRVNPKWHNNILPLIILLFALVHIILAYS